MAIAVTGTDICTQALKKAGILGAGVDAEAEDIADAQSDLNDMIAQWRVQRWLVYREIDLSFISTGALSYTIGPASNFVIDPRPDRIESAFLRQLVTGGGNQPVDSPLQVIEARETYSRIALKTQGSYPQYIWYDNAFPVGSLYPWPVPQATIYEVHVQVKMVLDQITNLAASISLPGEYFAALKFNLARRLRSSYRLPADQELNALAMDASTIIRGANAQIPRLQTPAELSRGGLYDVYSDQIY